MRLLVILSPTDRWGTKTEYTRLRKFLHKDGYLRIAPEVYMRIVHNNNNIYMVADEPDYQEKVVGTNSLY